MLVVASRDVTLLLQLAARIYGTEESSELREDLRRLLAAAGWTKEHVMALVRRRRRPA